MGFVMGILYLLWDIITDKGMFVKENLREGECESPAYPKLYPYIPIPLPFISLPPISYPLPPNPISPNQHLQPLYSLSLYFLRRQNVDKTSTKRLLIDKTSPTTKF